MSAARISTSHWGSFEAEVEDGRLLRTRPFRHDAYPTPLTDVVPDAVYSGSRVRAPAVRESWLRSRGKAGGEGRGDERFVEVDWETALDLVAGELGRVRADHGAEAIFGGSYGWSSAGRLHHARTLLHRMLYAGGGCVGQVTNYSYAAGMIILPHVVGNADPVAGRMTDWRAIVENTELMVFFGGINRRNFQVSSGGFGEHSTEGWLKKARDAGVGMVTVGPDRLDAAPDLGAEWVPIRPNSDTALMLGLSTTLLLEDRHDRAFLATHCVGFDRYADYLLGKADGVRKDAAWAAPITGIPAASIRMLARHMASSRTMLTASWSLQRADHGEQPYWALVALAAMLGQIGQPGCGFGFGYGSINGRGAPRRPIPSPTMSAGRNPLGFAIPVARVSDLLLQPGQTIDFNGRPMTFPDIRLVYWAGGNPFHHHQDLKRLTTAFRRPETVIVNEIWWTATAKHADIVLPATTPFERNDIGASPADRYIMAMPKLIEPLGRARNDFDIFADISDRLGYRPAFDEGRDEFEWLRHMYAKFGEGARSHGVNAPDFDAFWKQGWFDVPPPDAAWTAYADFHEDPVGSPLATPSGRIEIVSDTIASFGYADCRDHPRWLEPREWLGAELADKYPLHLISNQPATRLHSQLDNTRLAEAARIHGREPVRMNPADAEAFGLEEGDVVELYNDRGRCLAGLCITSDLMPGVVQLATGAWYDTTRLDGDVLETHGNPNMLTDDHGTSRLAQGPSPMSTLVSVRRFDGDLPPVRAFEPPV